MSHNEQSFNEQLSNSFLEFLILCSKSKEFFKQPSIYDFPNDIEIKNFNVDALKKSIIAIDIKEKPENGIFDGEK